MISVEWIWQLVGVVVTIAVWSVLFGDNPIYRLVEHIILGAVAGYSTFVMLQTIWHDAVIPLYAGNMWAIVPIMLSMLVFTSFTRWAWMFRYSMAVVIATGTALALRSGIDAQVVSQARDTMVPLWTGNLLTNFNNLVLIMITLCCSSFFLFTATEKGVLGRTIGYSRKLAIYLLMFAFGAGVIGYVYSWYTTIASVASYVLDFIFGIS